MQTELDCYNKLVEWNIEHAKRVGQMIDEGKCSEVIAQVIGGQKIYLGILVFFAANHMKKTGIRP
jgi:hypothetical protein